MIIKWVTLTTVYCNTMWWPPESGYGGLFNMLGFMSLACLTTFHYMAAMCDGPGFVPSGWRPDNDEDEGMLQFCDTCKGFKAPRAHHCRKCQLEETEVLNLWRGRKRLVCFFFLPLCSTPDGTFKITRVTNLRKN